MFNTLAKRAVASAAKFSGISATSFPKAVIARNASTRKRVAIDGNEAAAHAIYQVSDACMLFPITPSSGMGEHCDNWANKGLKNVFGQPVVITEMQVGFEERIGSLCSPKPVLLALSTVLLLEVFWVLLSLPLRV